nr:exonuclease domain-containing protein [Spiroplasma clarkii]
MEPGLKELLEMMNIYFTEAEEQEYFSGAKIIEKVFSKSKNEIRIYLSLNDFLPTHILHKLEFGLIKETNHLKAKINLCIANKNYTHDLIWRYIEYVKDNKAEYKTGTILSLSPASVLYDCEEKQVSFVTETETEKNLLLQHLQYYQAKLSKYGFEGVRVRVAVSENKSDEILNAVNEKFVQQAQQIVQTQQPVSTQTNTTNKPKQIFKAKVDLGKPDYVCLHDLEEDAMNVTVHGQIISLVIKKSKADRKIYTVGIADKTSAVKAVYFQRGAEITLFDEVDHETEQFFATSGNDKLKTGDWVALNGNFTYSSYDKEHVFYINKYCKIESKNLEIIDDAVEKRVELHTHTKMSAMDGVSDAKEYIQTAKKWGWKAIAITDHLNVQTYPDAFSALKEVNANVPEAEQLKLIYGSEIVVLEDEYWIVKNPTGQNLREAKFVIFDLETTGLSPEFDEIIEFGANVYDYATGKSKSEDWLFKPKQPISDFTTELTNITNDMLEDKNSIEVEFKKIYELIQGAILIAHNANFDFNFLDALAQRLNYPPLTNTVIDTMTLARAILPKLKNHRLGTVAKYYNIDYDEKTAHRADYDAEVLTSIFERIWSEARQIQPVDLDTDWNKFIKSDKLTDENHSRVRGYHLQVLAKNQDGLKDLFKIISFSHTKNFLNSPKIFKSELTRLNQNKNLLLGSGCLNGEVFENVRTGTKAMLHNTIRALDYIEVQPLAVYKKLLQTGDLTETQLKQFIKTIIQVAVEENKLVVATSDAHYVKPEAKIVRDIYINTKGLGGVAHPLFDYRRRVKDNPDQHLRTTNEMLEEFKFLEDSELIHEIVITNPNKIADLIQGDIKPLKTELYTPKIDNVDVLLRDECYKNAHLLYGENLPQIVIDRLERELSSIIKHGFAVIYWISHLLVKKVMKMVIWLEAEVQLVHHLWQPLQK